MSEIDFIKAHNLAEISEGLRDLLDRKYQYLLPADPGARILIKPNLNSNMNSLTGNTTDLRIMAALINYLKGKGYGNIVIGEGTNSGFYRNRIGVISRLAVDRLASYFGVEVKDLNYAEPHEILFEHGVKAAVARDTVDAELFINLPKLKTHFENGMSVCLKNLIGCLIGQENKKKTHDNLPENIIRINQQVKPHLHIVDALIGMEGLGPTKGVPVKMDTMVVGTDPYLIDLACARMVMFDYRQVRTLALAEKKGILTADHHAVVNSLALESIQREFALPKAGPLASFIHHPRRQKFFLRIRNTPFFSYLAATDWFGKLLFVTNLRQDVFISEERVTETLTLNHDSCDNCGRCAAYCPIGLDLPLAFNDPELFRDCLHCLYCFCVCPQRALQHRGELGFMKEQLRQYDDIVRSIT